MTEAADTPGQALLDAESIDKALAAIPSTGLPAGVAAAVDQARQELEAVLGWRAPFEQWRSENGTAAVGAGERQWPPYAELVTALDNARPALELASMALEAFLNSSLGNHSPRGWVTLNSQVIHQGPHVTLRRDDVIQPDGQEGAYEYIEVPATVRVLAINAAGEVALVEDHFYLLPRRPVLHLPGGAVEGSEGVELAAARELEQETGWRAEKLRVIGRIDPLPGAAHTTTHLLLATDLTPGQIQRDATEEWMTVRWVPAAEAVRLARSGGIREAGSLAAILLAEPQLLLDEMP
ncbi:8-oxo-dGTP pyrophosphatase MutT (NUDIX family) [Kitasatospora sp. GP30]|jgi:ADP-ribose pyrophosphatase|uniref:NUDIX domain-containing protein n=1 Tax=Kitasatospora sp. GP30 TaxID=3035084 RepID=UPI000CA6FA3D|nr:NUDIX hydrolase [Kitasatospora sp. GP30]MDH6138494.1 8-oxo-dGTP pyrophosphatase MutT (NUDIX family) [Kitasatospora sp. GP30]